MVVGRGYKSWVVGRGSWVWVQVVSVIVNN